MSLEEVGYLAASTGLAAYIIATAADTYLSLKYGHQSTPHHPLLTPWALPAAALLLRKTHWLYTVARKTRLHNCLPPTWLPVRDPLTGAVRAILAAMREDRVVELWHGWFRDHGDTVATGAMGSWVFFVNDPENVRAVLSKEFESFPIAGPRKLSMVLLVGEHSILSTNGREWREARALIRPTFVRDQVADLACMDRHLENFLAKIPRDGSTVDLQTLFSKLTIDTSTDFMFGQSTNTLTNPTKAALDFIAAFEDCQPIVIKISRAGWPFHHLPNREYDAKSKVLRDFVEGYIREALESKRPPERGYVFLAELARTGASPEQIRDQILGLILGGRDTTASALSSLFWILARRPDVVGKLREEVGGLGGARPTWEQLKNMRYLNAVLKEVLRLYPPVVTNSRQAVKDVVLPVGGGPDGKSHLFVPKGTVVRWSLYSIHRRQDIFGPDADEFRPERWETLRAGWEWMPFAGGPRICIGQQFALTQMLYTVVRMFQAFGAVEARDDKPMTMSVAVTIGLRNGCKVALTPA